MADAFVETLEDVSRRAALRTISTTLKTAAPPPFPPNIPYTVLWGDSDEILSPPSRLPIEFQLFANV